VLVIEDVQAIAELFYQILTRKFHCEVDRVPNCEEALQKLGSSAYDLILLDVRIPGMSGKQFYRMIREKDDALARKVVFTTGDVANAETLAFIEETGCLWLQKPFSLQQADDLLTRYFQNS
jgi:DNA-binding response OmpR family regulator